MPMRSTEGPTGALLASNVGWEASYGQVEVSSMLAAMLAVLTIMLALDQGPRAEVTAVKSVLTRRRVSADRRQRDYDAPRRRVLDARRELLASCHVVVLGI